MSLEINIEMLAAVMRETNVLLNKLIDATEGMEFPKQGPKIEVGPDAPKTTRTRAVKATVTSAPAQTQAPTYPVTEELPQALSDSDWGDFENFEAVEAPPVIEPPMDETKFMEEANRIVREHAIRVSRAKGITPAEALKLVGNKVPEASGQQKLALVAPANRKAVLANISRLAI